MKKYLDLKMRHRVLAVLFVTSIVSFVDRMAMTVALPFIKADFELTAVQSGLILSVFFAAYSTVQIPGGLLADRLGVRKVATAALVWWSIFTGITGSVANFTQMIIARFLFGLGEGVYPPCTFKTVTTWFPRRSRGTANAIMLSSSRLGLAIAPLAVVWIMSQVDDWRAVFWMLSLPGFALAALFWFLIPNSPSEAHNITSEELDELEEDKVGNGESENNYPKVGFWEIIHDITILRYVLIYFVFDFAFWGFNSWLPVYLMEARGFSAVQMGVTSSLPYFAGIAGCMFGGWISDRFFINNRRVPIILSPVVSSIFLYLTFVTTSVSMVMVYQTVSGFFFNIFFASFWAVPVSTVPKEQMGVTAGIINTAGQVAGAIAPVSVGVIIAASNGQFGWTFGVLISSLMLAGLLALSLPKTSKAHA